MRRSAGGAKAKCPVAVSLVNSASYRERLTALRCAVVVPTYNNVGTIAQVIEGVKRFASDIIVVNDGSTDETQCLLQEVEDLLLISYSKNRGKGYALKSAFRRAAELGFENVITIDSDGQHFADDIPIFIERMEQEAGVLLIGARNLAADNMPSKNTFANKFSNFWYRMETGKRLSDTQSGFRAYPISKLGRMRFLTNRYEFELEVIVRAAWKGIPVENVPIKVHYAPVGERVSHFRPLRDFARISLLNTILVLCALLFYYPWRFLQTLTLTNIRRFIDTHILRSKDSNLRMAAAMGWGVFCGIIPIWGYQMIFAGLSAHLLRLNKVVAVVFSNISVPPMIPFILYGSMAVGAFILNREMLLSFSDISFESIGLGLGQYIVGSIVLAAIAGVVFFSLSLLLMSLFKRRVYNE